MTDIAQFGGFLPLSGGVLTGALYAANGAAATPGIAFAGSTTTGLFQRTTNVMAFAANGVQMWETTTDQFKLRSAAAMGWSSSTTGGADTAFTRVSAGVIGAGTGTAGSTAATLRAAALAAGGSDFTITAANSVSPTSPNRTITIAYGGTTYYLAAKTTND